MTLSLHLNVLAGQLPIAGVLSKVCSLLAERHELVLEAPPGAGKTTLVPLALLDQPWLQGQKILMLEPRRLAAKNAAVRMAQLLSEDVGGTVGYRMRLESKVSRATRIEVVTEGVLTRMLQADPSLEGVGLVIFDEFHERSLDADLALALCTYARNVFREDQPLKLLVMSATLDGDAVAELLNHAPVLRSEGRAYPVETRYLPPPELGRGGRFDVLVAHLCQVVLQALDEESGSVLVFLPGQREIVQLAKALSAAISGNDPGHAVRVTPLFGDLPWAQQQEAIAPPVPGVRKVVLATNIAETSLTIEGVRVVIDSGLCREPFFDPNTALTRLHTTRISKAASEQRRGRAGRMEPGVCYRCWSETEQYSLPPYASPEMAQADLAPLVLQLTQWGVTPGELLWMTPPPPAAYEQACDLLRQLGALTGSRLTDHGQAMATLPAHPRIAHMLIKAKGVGEERAACNVAALLGERDLFPDSGADIQVRLEALSGARRVSQHLRGVLERTRQQADQFGKMLQRVSIRQSEGPAPKKPVEVGTLLGWAYPDRIAKKRKPGSPQYVLANGRAAVLDETDALVKEDWLVVAGLGSMKGQKEERIYLASSLAPATFSGPLSELLTEEDLLGWDADKQQIIAERQTRIGRILVRVQPLKALTSEQKAQALLSALQEQGLKELPWTEATKQLQARAQQVRSWLPDADLPDVSDTWLKAHLSAWLMPYISGMDRFAQLQSLDMVNILSSLLTWEQQRLLNEWAPPFIKVPTGSEVAIDYTQSPPLLAVKLQELFGLTETPAVAKGRVPLLLHLLSPARRPLQVTQDLIHFWRNGYDAVKKEMRGRYPKHPWPDDPVNATPARGTKKQEARRADNG